MNERLVAVSTVTGPKICGCFSKPRCDWLRCTMCFIVDLHITCHWRRSSGPWRKTSRRRQAHLGIAFVPVSCRVIKKIKSEQIKSDLFVR